MVYLNDGFAGFTPEPGFQTSLLNPDLILARDFDGDGRLDLAALNYRRNLDDPGSVQILFNTGSLSFDPAPPFFPASEVPFPEWLVTADFDRDGAADLALTDQVNGELSVFLNQFGIQAASVKGWDRYR